VGLAASLFVERASGGTSLRELIADIDRLAGSSTELVMKLHTIVAATLGQAMREALDIRFDQHLAKESLRFYDMRRIPAIRAEAPTGVSEIHFRSDLSNTDPEVPETLAQRHPALVDLLPA
jgi:hypothetical protein